MSATNKAPGSVPARLCDLVLSFADLSRRDQEGAPGLNIRDQVRMIGRTVAWCGGFDAMKRLHDEAEDCVGNNNSVGYWLNQFWDGIGGWWA